MADGTSQEITRGCCWWGKIDKMSLSLQMTGSLFLGANKVRWNLESRDLANADLRLQSRDHVSVVGSSHIVPRNFNSGAEERLML